MTDSVFPSSSTIFAWNDSATNASPAGSIAIPDTPAPGCGAVMFATLPSTALPPARSKYPTWSVLREVNHILPLAWSYWITMGYAAPAV
jgi:hypothetical protein